MKIIFYEICKKSKLISENIYSKISHFSRKQSPTPLVVGIVLVLKIKKD